MFYNFAYRMTYLSLNGAAKTGESRKVEDESKDERPQRYCVPCTGARNTCFKERKSQKRVRFHFHGPGTACHEVCIGFFTPTCLSG